MSNTTRATSTCKVRRDSLGGKRGNGNQRTKRIRRPDPRRIVQGRPDRNLTANAGLASFGSYVRTRGVDKELRTRFRHMKKAKSVVYPMEAQIRLAMDMIVAGETRVFGLEGLAADPLLVQLAGGGLPSVDTMYTDFERFDPETCKHLEDMVARHGLSRVGDISGDWTYMDVDTSVTPVDGELEGARPGPNPKYRGRPSYHPMFARVAQTDTLVGATLRPGDTGLGADDATCIAAWTKRLRAALPRAVSLCVRIDAGGDCADIIRVIHDAEAYYLIKARLTGDLVGVLMRTQDWKTTDRDACGKPTRQVAELDFHRKSWGDQKVRVIAVRTSDRDSRQLTLWEGIDLDSVHVFLTNRQDDADDIAWAYDGRAGIEPLIAEMKGALGLGHFSSRSFDANHAAMLVKMLAHNLVKRWVADEHPSLRAWRLPWLRRALVRVPGRLSRSGRRHRLHVPPHSALLRRRE